MPVRHAKSLLLRDQVFQEFSYFHLVIISIPNGTSDLVEPSGHSTVIDPLF